MRFLMKNKAFFHFNGEVGKLDIEIVLNIVCEIIKNFLYI